MYLIATSYIAFYIALVVNVVTSQSDFILSGDAAEVGQFPYQVSIGSVKGDIISHFCGGAIIDQRYVLTAAHCMIGEPVRDLIVTAGTIYLSEGGESLNVYKAVVHPDWNDDEHSKNDIAILKLTQRIRFNDYIQPISYVPKPNEHDSECVLSGWGATTVDKTPTKNLQYIDLRTISLTHCREAWEDSDGTVVYLSNICTQMPIQEGACYGDSGGPLVCDGVLAGIVSWGRPCGTGKPDVFIRVSAFQDFINKTMELNYGVWYRDYSDWVLEHATDYRHYRQLLYV